MVGSMSRAGLLPGTPILILVLLLHPGLRAQAPEEPGDASAAEEAKAHRQQLQQNLERWNGMSPDQREALRGQVRALLRRQQMEKRRLAHNAHRFLDLSPEERAELRRRHRAMAWARHGEGPQGYERMRRAREQMRCMSPQARKRSHLLRRLLDQLPAAEREEMRQLPREERRKRVRRLLREQGPEIFHQELGRRHRWMAKDLEDMPAARQQELLRAWLSSPEPSPGRFLRRHGLRRQGPRGEQQRHLHRRGRDRPGPPRDRVEPQSPEPPEVPETPEDG